MSPLPFTFMTSSYRWLTMLIRELALGCACAPTQGSARSSEFSEHRILRAKLSFRHAALAGRT